VNDYPEQSLKISEMKIPHIFIIVLILLLGSCSESEDLNEEVKIETNSDILTSKSPWQFERFTLIRIMEKENDTITEENVMKIVNDSYKGLALNFKKDGTGFTVFPGDDDHNWTWSFNRQDEICFNEVCDDEKMVEVKLIDDGFQFTQTSFSPEDENGNSALCVGRYFFR